MLPFQLSDSSRGKGAAPLFAGSSMVPHGLRYLINEQNIRPFSRWHQTTAGAQHCVWCWGIIGKAKWPAFKETSVVVRELGSHV